MDRTQRQKLGIKKWVQNRGNGILVYAVGVGKTRTALTTCEMLYKQNPNISILISVPTAVLKEQWVIEAAKYPFFKNVKVEVINTIVKNTHNVDFLIIDELHAALAATLVSIFDKVTYRYFLGLTGTLNRLDGREEILEKYTKVVDTITMEDAIKNN
jgi:superfamily II DNA or RNA helicase